MNASKQGATRAGIWSAADIFARQGVQFGVSVILARLLTPAEFGVVALLLFFTGFGTVVIQAGFGTALIQNQETDQSQESAIFWLSVAWSLVIAVLLLISAPFVATFYEQPILAPLMMLGAAQVVIAAVGAVPTALLTRALRFDQMAKVGVGAAAVSGAIGIFAAVQGLGAWALALQALTATSINTVALWWVSGWKPLLRLRRTGASPLVAFGSRVSFSNFVDHLYVQGFALTLGKLHGVADLGLYNRAHSTQHFAAGTLASALGRFALPLFSARAKDREHLLETVQKTIQLSMFINLPLMAGLVILSDLVIAVLFGPNWAGAAPILSVLAIAGIFWPLHVINIQLMLAVGRPDLFWKVEIAKKSVGVMFVIVGSMFGVIGLAISQVVFGIFSHFFNGYFIGKLVGYGAWRQLWDVAGAAACSFIMVVTILLARPHLPDHALALIAWLTIIGSVTFLMASALFRISSFKAGLAVITTGLNTRR